MALTLRKVCGLTTEEIARAFLTPAPKPKSEMPVFLLGPKQ